MKLHMGQRMKSTWRMLKWRPRTSGLDGIVWTPAQAVPEADPIPGLSCCLNKYISFLKSPLLLNFLSHAPKRVLSVTLFNQFIY